MAEVLSALLSRLSSNGLGPEEVLRLMRDLFNIVKEDGDCRAPVLNQRLRSLGWTEDAADQSSVELFMAMIEKLGETQIRRMD
jgi:hypothetical protein